MEDDPWLMVQKKGHQFVINDKPFYVNGFNTYWLMVFAADPFKQASAVGLNLCRTWAFNDGRQWRALQKSPSVYDETVFQQIDIRSGWEAYGGKPQYIKWGKEAGLNLASDDDFFSHPIITRYYKAHVQVCPFPQITLFLNTFTKVTYRDDRTIFAWELMNEPRCTSDTLQAWIEEMAKFVKSIDPKHMVEIGLEGFYGRSTPNRLQYNPNTYAQQVGTDFIRNHQVLGIDYASAHMYPDSWISQPVSAEHFSFVRNWMQSHTDDAENILKMPVVFAELGVSTHAQGYTTTYRDSVYSLVYKELLTYTRKGGSGAASLMWQFFPNGTNHMDDSRRVCCGSIKMSFSLEHHFSPLHQTYAGEKGFIEPNTLPLRASPP
ncbi:hypothetical protein QQ045_024668 [Rhodiola kirilowii]